MDISDLVQTPASSQPVRKPYWQVLDEYRQALDELPELQGMSVPEFASGMGQGYEEGLGADNWLRKVSANIDIGLHHFGGHVAGEAQRPLYVPYKSLSESVGGGSEGWDLPAILERNVKSGVEQIGGSQKTAEKVGAVAGGLPRMALDVGVGSLVGGIPGVAAMSGLSTYGETGRFAPSALSAATAAVFPKAAQLGGEYVLGKLGAKTLAETRPDLMALLPKETAAEIGGKLAPSNLVESLGRFGGAQAGMLATGVAGETAQTLIRPDETWGDKFAQIGEEFSPSSLIATGVGQLPFTVMDLAGVNARPLARLENTVKAGFADRFTQAYRQDTGKDPSQKQIDDVFALMQKRGTLPKVDTPIGQALASIGRTPVEMDLKRPIQTTEGEWNMGDAIEQTRAEAQRILTAQPELGVGNVGQAHDLKLYSALRAVQGQKSASKQDMARAAANRFVDTLRGDNTNLDRISSDYARMERDELVRQRNLDNQNRVEAEIVSKVEPELPDGSSNPLYDADLHRKVMLVSGDAGQRVEVGLDKPLVMSARAGKGETLPLPVSIIDAVRGLVPKVGGEKEGEIINLQDRIAKLDAQINGVKSQPNLDQFDNPELDRLTGERIQLDMTLQDLTGGDEPNPQGKTKAQQLTADATFAARRAALRYTKALDFNDPVSVRDFYEYVKAAINQAERGWLRERRDQSTVTDAEGKALTFADRNDAVARADVLNEGVDENDGVRYTVPETPRADGTYHIVKNRYFRATSLTPQEAGQIEPIHEVGTGEIPFDVKAEEAVTGIPSQTLDQLGTDLKALEHEAITARFQELSGLNDPAVREGRKAALAQNVIDFVSGLPDSTIERVLREEVALPGERLPSIRQPALRKARFVKFMQFLRDGGDVSLKVTKKGALVSVRGEGNLDAMNDYFGDLGVRVGNRFNSDRVQGLNFFEQFYVLSKFLQKEFVDPRAPSPEQRPRGDFGWVPPGFREQLEEKLTVEWPKGYEKAIGVKQAHWADVSDAVKEDAVLMRERSGEIRRFAVDKNPLQTMFVKGAKHDLLTSAGKLVEMFSKFAPDVDAGALKLLKGLVDASPFIRNLNVGFGIAKDPAVKGYFHTDDFASSAGVLLSPFKEDVSGRNVASLMSPAEVLPHFLHELGHAGTQFAYVRDAAFKTEVDRVFDYVKQYHTDLVDFGAQGKFAQSQLHGLTSSVEMLASVWHDPQLQAFLKRIKDPFEPLSQGPVNVPLSMFDRIIGLIRSVLTKFVGEDGADSMLARVSELAARGLETQRGLDLKGQGDIYGQLYARGNIEGDVLKGQQPQPVPKTPTDEGSRTFLPGTTEEAPQTPTTDATGQALESKVMQPVSATSVLDSLKSASDYVTEDHENLWFKPFDSNYFRQTYQPMFGNKMLLKQEGGQWGYLLPKSALQNITDKQLLQMPRPKVRTWAPSAFETMRSLFKQQGSSDQTAEALASYNLQFMALLKNSDRALWGVIAEPKDPTLLGMAWGRSKIGGLTALAGEAESLANTVRHESTHLAGFHDEADRYETPDVRASVNYSNQLFSELNGAERRSVLEGLSHLSDQTQKTKLGGAVYENAMKDSTEFAAEFMAHVGDSLGNVPNPSAYLRDVLRFAPDDVSNMVKLATLRRSQALDQLKRLVKSQAHSRGLKSDLSPVIDGLSETFRGLARGALEIATDQAEFYRMRNLYPDMYKPLLLRMAERLDKFGESQAEVEEPTPKLTGTVLQSREPQFFTDIKRKVGLDVDPREPAKASLWTRTLAQFALFVEQHPIARPFYDMLESVQGQERHAIAQVSTMLAGAFEGGKLVDDVRTKQVVQFAKSPRMRQLFSDIALDMQTEGDKAYRDKLSAAEGDVFQVPEINVATPEYMDAIYRKYGASDKERKVLDTVFAGTRNQIKAISLRIVGSQLEATKTITATAIQRATELAPEAARETSKTLSDYVELRQQVNEGKSLDMQGLMNLDAKLAQAVPDQVVRERLVNLMDDSWMRIRKLERFLTVRMPYYLSERRMGDYGLWWKGDDGKVLRHYFKTGDERQKFVTRQNVEPIRQTDPNDKNYGVSDDVFAQLNEIQTKLSQRLIETFGEAKGQELSTLMDAATELRNALAARDVLKVAAPRKGAPSRQFLDMFDVHQDYVRAVLNGSKNRQLRLEAELLLNADEFANQPVMKGLLQSHLNNVIKPDTELGRVIQSVNFTYFMGFGMSNMILEPFQQLMALAPVLTQHGASISGSYRLIGKANAMWAESKTRGNHYRDQEIEQFVNRARNDGVVDQGILSELEHNSDLIAINRLRGTSGQSEWSPFDMLKNRLYQFANLARRFYGVVPAYNSEIGFVASYLQAKAQGLKGEEAYSQARFLTRQSMLGGGKINRPIGLFDKVPRTAAQAMWSLQSYGTSMMTIMGHLIKQSASPKGLTPAQTTQVRKAMVQMTATQFALAGALGMPFAQVGILALQKLFPQTNVEQGVRDFLDNLAGDDEASGGWFGTMLQKGVPSAFSEAPDMGSRFALSSTLGVSPYNDFSFANFVGPTASVLQNVFKAMQAGAQGDIPKTVENLMPRGPLRLWKAMEQQNQFMSQSTGKLLADDLSPAEIVGRAVGFTPARVARLQDADRLSRLSVDAEKVQQSRWVDKAARQVQSGDSSGVRQAIAERVEETHGTRRPEELARAVAKRVEERMLPTDPRKFGNKSTVATQRQLKGVLGEQTQTPSNLERLQVQQQVLQELGIGRAMIGPSTVRRASALDNLLELYPHLTVPQATLLLDHSASRPTDDQFQALLSTP